MDLEDMTFDEKKSALLNAGRELMNDLLPISWRIAGKEIEDARGLVLHSRAPFTKSFELMAFVRVLRACILGDRDAPFFRDDLLLLAAAINKEAGLRSEAFKKTGPYFVTEHGSWERSAVHDLARYTRILASDARLTAYAPIGICANCEGIFYKIKRDQRFCSPKCRMSRWAKSAGKEYYVRAQRRRRAEAK